MVHPGTCFSTLTSVEARSRITAHEYAITKLVKTISHHRRAIARYQGCLNELVPYISKLPREILTDIFLRYRASCFGPFHSWLRVVHVCRAWRNIALATPLLFSHIEVLGDGPSLRTKEFLRISNRTPLHIRVHPEDRYLNNWEPCIPHLPRVRTLELHEIPRKTKWPVCPMLTSLTFAMRNAAPSSIQIFCDVMPNLQCLSSHVSNLGRGWLSTIFPHTLQTLRIAHDDDLHFGTMAELIQQLVSLPHLENLDLWCMDSNNYALSTIRSDLQIRHLNSLRLTGHSSSVIAILHHVRSFNRVHVSTTGEDMARLSRMLQDKWTPTYTRAPHVEPDLFYSLSLELSSEDTVSCDMEMEMELSTGILDQDEFPFTALLVKVDITEPLPTAEFCILFRLMAQALSPHLSLVTHTRITFQESDNVSVDTNPVFRTILDTVPRTVHLDVTPDSGYSSLHESFASKFPFALAIPHDYGGSIALPNLREIKISIHTWSLIGVPNHVWDNIQTLFTNLYNALCSRKLQSLEIDALAFDPTGWAHPDNPLEEIVDRLRDVVGEVVLKPPPAISTSDWP